ncbi:MAG: amino acid permease [Burkholderiales bacterium]|nr:amino acid permease [Burkholderiales bacterium]MDP2400334.1 amino acid permease [Burkholderiales bacterium]
MSTQNAAAPRQTLSVTDACAMIVGLIVGAGIFGTPSIVAGAVGGETTLYAVWIAGGVFSIIGALCYAELATAFPSAGGEYHFLQRAFGRSLAFLYGWARMTVIVAGSIAVFAYLFGDYMSRVISFGAHSSAIWAALVVVVLTYVNYRGIREGKATQNVFTALEVGGLVLIVIAGLFLAAPPEAAAPVAAGAGQPWYMGAGIGSAMIFVLFTYGGWNDAAYISAEVRDRDRNMVRALLIAISVVALLYVLVNAAFLKGLGYDAMARSNAVAADLMKAVWGTTGEKLIAVMIAIAALTSVNGSMIVGARSNYALGRDWPMLSWIGRWDDASGSPRNAMLAQGAIALALVGLGAIQNAGFKGLIEYSLPVFWGFFLLTGIALFVLRAKEPDAPRPFRVPLYPVLPAVFVLVCGYLLYSSLTYHGSNALVGLGVLAIGGVVLAVARRSKR